MNYPDECTISRPGTGSIDPDTGVPSGGAPVTVVSGACAFAVLSGAEQVAAFGETPEATNLVVGLLLVPNWQPSLPDQDNRALGDYSVSVIGYPQTFTISAARPGREWTTYRVVAN